MDIKELTTQQKSVLLAEVMGWHRGDDRYDKFFLYDKNNERIDAHSGVPNLYLPLYMPLAWRVLNWAMDNTAIVKTPICEGSLKIQFRSAMYEWFFSVVDVTGMPPAEAQAAWLDKVLELAIEAGLVKENSK